ncbi:MAG: peptidase domain-containing ABC transporter [Magnetococcales bacterium]|nr:peptidase domain-containing ABC transporter [Magnetococcales bacterium]
MSAMLEAIQYILETHNLFSVLSDADKRFLETLFQMRTLAAGEMLAKQGEPMDGFHYLYSGKIRLKQTDGGKRVSLGVLERDAGLGESALLGPETWPYDVVAEEPVVTFVLPGERVRKLLETNEEIARHFRLEIAYVISGRRLRGMLGKAACPPDAFRAILHELGLKTIPAGKPVFQQGDSDPRIYYLELGEVDLIRTPLQGEGVVLERLSRGALFGESGALLEYSPQGKQPHTAMAVTEVTLMVVRQSQVKRILELNPELHEQLRVRVKELQAREHDELAVRQRAEGVDQRIRLSAGVTEEEYRIYAKEEQTRHAAIRHFPLVRQRAESDCGAACLTMISNHYGKAFSLGQVVELTHLSTSHVTPNTIITGAEILGYNANAYSLTFEELQKIALPAIIGWEGYHYAVLYSISGKNVHLADPAQEKLITLTQEKFLEGWTSAEVPGVAPDPGRGVFIALQPTQKLQFAEPPKRPIFHFVRYLLPYKKYFFDAMIGALILNCLGLASPLFIQTIVDTVVVHKDGSLLNMMLAGMILVALFRSLTTIFQSMLLAHTTSRIDIKLMSEFYRHILSLPMSFFLMRNKGEILTRFGENAKIRAILTGSTITVVLSVLMMFLYLIMMFAYNSTVTWVALFFIPLQIAITLYYTPRIKQISNEMFLTNSKAQSYLIESLNGIETLKATANEYMARARWEDAFVDNVNMGFRMQKLNLISNTLNQLVQLSSTVAILWIGATLVMKGTMSIGELMGFQMLLAQVMGPIGQILQLWNSSQDVRIAVERVSDVLNVQPEQESVIDPERLPSIPGDGFKGRIVFDKVNFSYVSNGKENCVMKDFELTIEPGEHVAFVGAAGCGKSTIAKMILGFNMPSPTGGTCTIDGKDIRALHLDALRRNIGVVLQDSFLFSGTVADNIALGDPEPDMVAIKDAARLAGADEFVINMPLGYNTLIGEKGIGVSGGQRQRICIARALYRRPKIMLFDEATSALDNVSEARIQENMKTILSGRTSITIAHRLSTIIDSDRICYIKDGKVAEMGTHAQLIDPDHIIAQGYAGLYYRLAQTQFGLPPLESVLERIRAQSAA